MAHVEKKIWRHYDIRGIVPEEVNPETAEFIGKGYGTYAARNGAKTIVVGNDCRLSSDELTASMIKGILSTGCNVRKIGMVPTPLMYFAVEHFRFDAGIMVTASHNPPNYNGFKMKTRSRSLYGDDIQEIARLVENADFESGSGKAEDFDVVNPYIDFMSQNIKISKPLKVVIDAGNGSAGPLSVRLFETLGCEVVPLFCDPDGNFPNHVADPTIPKYMEALKEKVISTRPHLGLAFDGDGDRLGAMTPSGNLLWGDKMLSLFVDYTLKKVKSPVVFDVKCSMTLIEKIKEIGAEPVMCRTGYPLVQAKMKETKALLGGEMSGHIYFSDRYYGFDDALYAACRFVEIVSNFDLDLEKTVNALPTYPSTPELRLHCPEEAKKETMQTLVPYFSQKYDVIDIDGVRFTTDEGWGLFRASNTEPAIVARFEAKQVDSMKEMIRDALDVLKTTPVGYDEILEFLENK